MRYCFDDYELDTAQGELRHAGSVVAVEPQVYALLTLLVENSDRLISRDELIERVWEGRIVSDAAIASRIKSARRAVGDDGVAQRAIRTAHGRGFRFVSAVQVKRSFVAAEPKSTTVDPSIVDAPRSDTHRPSIAVLPFHLLGSPTTPEALVADALPHEIIAALSRLRWLFVIARGSSFRFRQPDRDIAEVGQMLNVHYCLTGTIELAGAQIFIVTELIDTRTGGVLWGDRLSIRLGDFHDARTQIVSRIVNALELQIPINEAQQARLAAPGNLDTWAAYHLGLVHMYRFNRNDNSMATELFQQAIARDPTFSRAHAGLSFTRFQSAFLRYTPAPAEEARLARRAADRAVELDPADPFANFTLGRSFWLAGDLEASLPWLDRAISFSPNYAQGIYARAWAQTVSGNGVGGRSDVDTAMALSPLDPLMYAMLGVRALTHAVSGEYAEAAVFAEKSTRSPGAHVFITMIAVVCQALAGNHERSTYWAKTARQRRPEINKEAFLAAFPFNDLSWRGRIASVLEKHGL